MPPLITNQAVVDAIRAKGATEDIDALIEKNPPADNPNTDPNMIRSVMVVGGVKTITNSTRKWDGAYELTKRIYRVSDTITFPEPTGSDHDDDLEWFRDRTVETHQDEQENSDKPPDDLWAMDSDKIHQIDNETIAYLEKRIQFLLDVLKTTRYNVAIDKARADEYQVRLAEERQLTRQLRDELKAATRPTETETLVAMRADFAMVLDTKKSEIDTLKKQIKEQHESIRRLADTKNAHNYDIQRSLTIAKELAVIHGRLAATLQTPQTSGTGKEGQTERDVQDILAGGQATKPATPTSPNEAKASGGDLEID